MVYNYLPKIDKNLFYIAFQSVNIDCTQRIIKNNYRLINAINKVIKFKNYLYFNNLFSMYFVFIN